MIKNEPTLLTCIKTGVLPYVVNSDDLNLPFNLEELIIAIASYKHSAAGPDYISFIFFNKISTQNYLNYLNFVIKYALIKTLARIYTFFIKEPRSGFHFFQFI